jgi:hypothetical protein
VPVFLEADYSLLRDFIELVLLFIDLLLGLKGRDVSDRLQQADASSYTISRDTT